MTRPSFSMFMALLPTLLIASSCNRKPVDNSAAFSRLALKIRQGELAAAAGAIAPGMTGHEALADKSLAAIARQDAMRLDALQALDSIDTGALPGEQVRLHVRLLVAYRNDVRMSRFGYGDVGPDLARPYVITHVSGAWIDAPRQLAEGARFSVLSDAQEYMSRLTAVSRALSDERLHFMADASRGVMAPRPVLERAHAAITRLADTPAGASVWLAALNRELDRIAITDPDTRTALTREAETLVTTQVQPAYHRLADAISERLADAPEDLGAWRLPPARDDGPGFYESALSIHAGPDADLSRLQADAMAQTEDLAAATSGLLGTMVLARTAPPPEDANGRFQLLSAIAPPPKRPGDPAPADVLAESLTQQLVTSIENLGDVTSFPPPRLSIELSASPHDPGDPVTLLPQGADTAIILVRAGDFLTLPDWRRTTVFFGDSLPGEALLGTPRLKAPADRNLVLATYRPFAAAWKAYAEDLAAETGLVEDTTLVRIGYLVQHQRRSALMAADIGLNASQWSLQEAIDFLVAKAYFTPDEAMEQAMQLVALPGEAISAPYGRSLFRRLRQEARTAIGPGFNPIAFNDVILKNGPRPFSFVETDVRRWIADQRPGLPVLPAADDPRGAPQPDPANAVSPSDPT